MKDIAEDAIEKNERLLKRNNKLNIIIIAAIFIGVILYSVLGKGGKGSARGFHFSEDGMIITDSEGKIVSVPYTAMEEVTLIEEAEYGEPVNGEITGVLGSRQMEGTFASPMFGEYTAACSPKIKSAVLIKTQDTSYVINMENDQSTAALYDAILRMLEEK